MTTRDRKSADDKRELINKLAEYFTGKCVGMNSVALQIPSMAPAARAYFDLRSSFGVTGYDGIGEAVRCILRAPVDQRGREIARRECACTNLVPRCWSGMAGMLWRDKLRALATGGWKRKF